MKFAVVFTGSYMTVVASSLYISMTQRDMKPIFLATVVWTFCHPAGWPQSWKTWNTQGFLWTWKTREFCATSGKNCNKQSILVRHSKICVKQLVTCYIAGVDVEWPLMKVIITLTFWCDNLWKSKVYGSGKAWKYRGIFFSYFVATLSSVQVLCGEKLSLCSVVGRSLKCVYLEYKTMPSVLLWDWVEAEVV